MSTISNDYDVYMLRRKIQEGLFQKTIDNVPADDLGDDHVYMGINIVLELLTDITGVDFQRDVIR